MEISVYNGYKICFTCSYSYCSHDKYVNNERDRSYLYYL